ncbi:hypothetical protein RAD15_39095 [Bradyrhizobium sp. 14AA]
MPYRRTVAATWRGAYNLSRIILSFSSSNRHRWPVSAISSRSISALRRSLSIGKINNMPHSAMALTARPGSAVKYSFGPDVLDEIRREIAALCIKSSRKAQNARKYLDKIGIVNPQTL